MTGNNRPVHDPVFREGKITCRRCNKKERIIRSLYTKLEANESKLTSLQQLLGSCKETLNRWVTFFDTQTLSVQPIYWEKKLKDSKKLLTLLEKEGCE